MTQRMEDHITRVLRKEQPEWVIVYGDTNSTAAGAKAAKDLNIKLAHVEAGLRSYNMNMAEERNRIVTDKLSDLLFCPTEVAVNNLYNEGFDGSTQKIILSGDVMFDSVLFYKKQLQFSKPSHVLATLHRAETTNNPNVLTGYFKGLEKIHDETKVVMPLHPRTKKVLRENDLKPNIEFIEPQSYLSMLQLIGNCEIVITDSGGLQKEAFYMQKPCITMRSETEWTELIEAKVNQLVEPNPDQMLKAYFEMRERLIPTNLNFYGTGRAASVIVQTLLS